MNLWAAQWHSKNRLNGETKHILCENCLPKLFHTRKEARYYINLKYGYIRDREDLQQEPFGWRLPRAVKVKIEIEEREDGNKRTDSKYYMLFMR
jgi:hypothetical protein